MSRDLRPLFAPRSVAVVGASADPSKWGNVLARGALRGAHRRAVYLVNRAGGEILGTRAVPSLGDVPEAPELVVLSVPAAGFEAAVDDALAAGAKAIVGISAGLGELDEAGKEVEAAVTERVRAAGAVLLGPNCLGVFDADAELDLGWSALPAGEIALISQSGNLALELARLAAASGLGFSRFVSLGNQADLVAADLLDELAAHERTRVIALYLEDFRDGRALRRGGGARSRSRHTRRPAAGRDDRIERACRAIAHRGARQRLACDRRGVRGGWDRPGRDADAADRRRPGAARRSVIAAGGASPSTPTVAVTGSSRATSSPPPGSTCRRSLHRPPLPSAAFSRPPRASPIRSTSPEVASAG